MLKDTSGTTAADDDIPIAAASIRFGNLMNSEIVGTPSSARGLLCFTSEDLIPRHPSQLYEALVYYHYLF